MSKDNHKDEELKNSIKKLEPNKQKLSDLAAKELLKEIPFLCNIRGAIESIEKEEWERNVAWILNDLNDKIERETLELNEVKSLLTDHKGWVLVRKVIDLVDGVNTTDVEYEEYLGILSDIISSLSKGDFVKLFQSYNYAVSQIERMSPQALILLARYKTWPTKITWASSTSSGYTVGSGWESAIVNAYMKQEGLSDQDLKKRMFHIFEELHNLGLISPKPISIDLTGIGLEVFCLISKSKPI